MKTNIFLILILLCVSSSVFAQNGRYKVIDTHYGWDVSFDDMMKEAKAANIVIIGEEHNDSMAHVFQYDVLKALTGLKGSDEVFFSMEMFERDVQEIMNEYLAGWISEKNFVKESRAWNNYKDYRPMVEYCKENNVAVICANTPARYVNMVTRNSLRALRDLPKNTRKQFLPPFPVDTLSGRYAEKFWGLMGDAAHQSPQMRFLFQSQNLWDATMAYSILEALVYHPHHTVLHINGRFHSDEYLGVTERVKRTYSREGQVVTITCVPAEEYKASEHKELADYVILTGI